MLFFHAHTGFYDLIKNMLFLLEVEKPGFFYWKREVKEEIPFPSQKGTKKSSQKVEWQVLVLGMIDQDFKKKENAKLFNWFQF